MIFEYLEQIMGKSRFVLVTLALVFLTGCATAEPNDQETPKDTGTGTDVYYDSDIETDSEMDTEDTAEMDSGTDGDTDSDGDTHTDSETDTVSSTETDSETDTGTGDEPEEITIFYDSFEDPDVTGTTGTDPHGWVTTAHPDYVGLNDVDSGLFTTPYGSQAMKIYSIATATTTTSILSEVLEANTTYTLSFSVAKRNDQAATGYLVELLAINDLNAIETVLGTATGTSLNTSDMSHSDSIVFTPNAGHANLGERLAIRFKKREDIDWTTNPQYDNVRLTTKKAS